jgi:hypothetical protein
MTFDPLQSLRRGGCTLANPPGGVDMIRDALPVGKIPDV